MRGDDQDPRTRQLMAERERKRNTVNQFDPVEGSPTNSQRIKIKNVYESLLEAGEDDAAERLRSEAPVSTQVELATKLSLEYDLEIPGASYD